MIRVQIAVGRFELNLGEPHGTRVERAPKPDADARDELSRAFGAPRQPLSVAGAADAVTEVVGELEDVTAAVERANHIATTLARGLTLDPKTLEQQLGYLLTVLDRADRDGRFDDELRLARALVSLLALIPRWLALLEVLRRVASAAAAMGERAGEAWAHHELGSLALGADDGARASAELNRALALREALDDVEGAEATRRNLELLPLVGEPMGLWSRLLRRPALVALAAVAVLVAGGALAVAAFDDDGESAETTTAETGTTETTEQETTTAEDTVEPTVVLGELAAFVNGTVTLTATAEDGDSGVAAVAFSASGAPLGEDSSTPYSATWDTTAQDDGPTTVEAVATDVAGNRATARRETTVDNTGPTITVGAAEPIENGVRLTANAEDAGSGVERVVFEVTPASGDTAGEWSEVGEGVASAPPLYELDLDFSDFSSGDYLFRARGFDGLGNETESSNEGRFNVPVE